ncbi:MAG: hypothetical protein JXA21_21710 [Anaerolineae bacterium]|nr:hypothetical protein [Anaerolineae bacterium]
MKKITMFLSVCCLLAAALSGCADHRSLASTPDPTPTLIPLTEAERAKIDPDLLAVIEWEEQHPGEGREVAPEDFLIDGDGQVRCIIKRENATKISIMILLKDIKNLARDKIVVEIQPDRKVRLIPITAP